MKVNSVYRSHFKDDAQGHIFIEKEGACTIGLTGASSMTQKELNFYGELFSNSINTMTPKQVKTAKELLKNRRT